MRMKMQHMDKMSFNRNKAGKILRADTTMRKEKNRKHEVVLLLDELRLIMLDD